MATSIMLLFLGIISFVIVPWIAQVNHYNLHKTDLMAGGEGE